MSLVKLPTDLQGDWIWKNDSRQEVDSYVFFRHEFTLDQIPTSADFWVAGISSYHVYINGRHFCRGEHPSSSHTVTVNEHDVAFCLQYGRNVVSILVHNADISRFGAARKTGALWCQLNVDGQTVLTTSEEWRVRAGTCYAGHRPRVSSSDGFIEVFDMRDYPEGWTEEDFDFDETWQQASALDPVTSGRWSLQTLPSFETVSEHYSFLNLVVHGTAEPNRASSHVYYPRAETVAGVYVADSYVHSHGAADDVAFHIFTDDPFLLFINGELVVQRGSRKTFKSWTDPDWSQPRCYAQDEHGSAFGAVSIKEGANHIRLIQLADLNSSGATIVFPEVESGAFRFSRGTDAISMPGWEVTGPLNVPFSEVSEHLELSGKHKDFYYTSEPHDSAAYLISHTFHVDESHEVGMPIDDVGLDQGQFMILELEKYLRGAPELEITANEGDIIDIVYGDSLEGDILNPIKDGVRSIYTVIADQGTHQWHGIGVHGMKYLMIFCRKAAEQVLIREVGVRHSAMNLRESASFACSEELMNQIWETGQRTLHGTYDSVFLNSGGQQEYQFLPSAMVQSLASMYLFGSVDFSERAIRDFALNQYETGEMPVASPSDYSVRMLDGMLLWPVWLFRHLSFSGDLDFIKEMEPNLRSLLGYFERMAESQGGLLGVAEADYVNPCIIDFDENLERRGISTALNGFYCAALLKAGWLYEQMGNTEMAHTCGKQASDVAGMIRELTWNEEKGLFADSWIEGEMSDSCSMQSNVMALASGIAKQEDYDGIFNKIFIDYAPFQNLEVDPHSDNPYFKFFLLDMAYALGHREWCTDYIRYYWGGMIQKGADTWWERFSPELDITEQNPESRCHGYGVSVNYFIISEVLGVRPVDPGFYQIYFSPHLAAVEWAKASIPTPHGHIKFEWRFTEEGDLEISIDSSYPLEVAPQLSPEFAAITVMKVGDNVSILQ